MACDIDALIRDASCFECNLGGVMYEAAEIVLLCAILDGDTSLSCDPQALMNEAACLVCKVPPGLFPAMKLNLLCSIAADA